MDSTVFEDEYLVYREGDWEVSLWDGRVYIDHNCPGIAFPSGSRSPWRIQRRAPGRGGGGSRSSIAEAADYINIQHRCTKCRCCESEIPTKVLVYARFLVL